LRRKGESRGRSRERKRALRRKKRALFFFLARGGGRGSSLVLEKSIKRRRRSRLTLPLARREGRRDAFRRKGAQKSLPIIGKEDRQGYLSSKKGGYHIALTAVIQRGLISEGKRERGGEDKHYCLQDARESRTLPVKQQQRMRGRGAKALAR